MNRRVAVVGVALGSFVLGACSPGGGGETPAPTVQPSFVCVDDGLRSAGPCSQADFEAQQKEQAQFAEAKRVYEEFLAERNRLSQLGGADEPSPRMRELAQEPYLTDYVAYLHQQKASGTRSEGQVLASKFKADRSRTQPGAAFTLSLCEDGTKTHAWSSTGEDLGTGKALNIVVFFVEREGSLKLSDWDSERTSTCA